MNKDDAPAIVSSDSSDFDNDPAIIVPDSPDLAEKLANYFLGKGPLPEGSVVMTHKEFMAIGRVENCDCQQIICVCEQVRQHVKGCFYRKSIECPIPIDCDDHGLSVCAECYPCTCKSLRDQISQGILPEVLWK